MAYEVLNLLIYKDLVYLRATRYLVDFLEGVAFNVLNMHIKCIAANGIHTACSFARDFGPRFGGIADVNSQDAYTAQGD